MKKILFATLFIFLLNPALGNGIHIPVDTALPKTKINKKANNKNKNHYLNKKKSLVTTKDSTETNDSYIPTVETNDSYIQKSDINNDDYSLTSWVGNKLSYTAFNEYKNLIMKKNNLIYQRNPIFNKYFPNGNIEAPIANSPNRYNKSIVLPSRFDKDGNIQYLKVKATPNTIKEHKDYIDVLTNMGFQINENENNIEVLIPNRYLNKDGRASKFAILRSMFLINESVPSHFYLYPTKDIVSILIKTPSQNNLVSYDLCRNWNKRNNDVVFLDINKTTNDDNGYIKNVIYYKQ